MDLTLVLAERHVPHPTQTLDAQWLCQRAISKQH